MKVFKIKRFRNFATLFLVLSSVFFFTGTAMAADLCVSDAAGLQAALTTAAGNGQDDTIQIVQGTYVGNFVYSSITEAYNLAVEGGYTAGCVSRVVDPANTILDGNNANTVLVFSTDQTVDFSMEGLTIQNGSAASDGGGLFINYSVSGNDVTISNSVISNNSSGADGGGLYINYAAGGNAVTITNSMISNNAAVNNGGGIYSYRVNLFNLTDSVISGNDGRGVYALYTSSATVTGNTINNNDGGVYISSSSGSELNLTATLTGNTISDNTVAGGVYIAGFYTSNITGNVIRNNQGAYNGGIRIYGVTTGTTPTMNLTNNTIDYNSVSDNHIGAGVHISSGSWAEVTFTGNTINNNNGSGVRTGSSTATFNNNDITDNIGVGVKIDGPATFINNTITGNTSNVYGGGVAIGGFGIFTNNTITGNTSTYAGGGVYCGAATFTDNIISDNTGGGVYAMPGKDGSYSITLTNNTITGNSAGSGVAVAALDDFIDLYGFDSATFTNNTITGNSADTGGGVYFFYTRTITLTNNTITGNSADTGGGMFLFSKYDSDTADIYNNIIWSNSAATLGADIWIDNDGDLNYLPSTVNLFNNDFDQSASGTYIKIPFTIDPSNLDNIDPLFVDPAGGDYHLQAGSPVIDMGDNSAPSLPLKDKDGNPRIVNSVVDMGAYEYQEYEGIFFDDFNDGDDAGWTVKSGTWEVVGGQYSETSAYSSPGVSVAGYRTDDMTIGAKAKNMGTGGFSNFFIVFAYDEANGNAYWAGARIGNTPPGAWIIEEVNLNTGSSTQLAEVSEYINVNTWYDLKVAISGDTVTMYADGAEKVSYTFPGGMPVGWIGLGGHNNQALFDDFAIDTDGDGILDDGDNSGVIGDNKCTGGNTVNCDDNCSQTANSGQQDTDGDLYGNMCDCDLNNDGSVGVSDYNIFKDAWRSRPTSANWNPDADFNSDDSVGVSDYNIFKTRWRTRAPWE